MIKLGVYKIGQLVNGKDKSFFGGTKKVSISLLNAARSQADSQELYDRIMLELVDDRGAYKRTSRDRFVVFDAAARNSIKESFSDNAGQLKIHDVGVSSAQTSADFYTCLRNCTGFPEFELSCTDYDPYLTLVSDGRLSVTLSSRDDIIEILWPPFVFTPLKLESKHLYPLNHVVRKYLLRTKVPILLRKYQDSSDQSITREAISVFCPDAIALSEKQDNFHLGQYNLLEPRAEGELFHCVRAMNVLNETYFTNEQFQRVLENIWNSLNPNGLLIAGSNEQSDTPVTGGVFQKSTNGFQILQNDNPNPGLDRQMEAFNQRL